MMLFWGRTLVVALALVGIAAIWFAGVVRERLGWASFGGQMAWLVLGCPLYVAIGFAQIVLYRRVAGASPFEDAVAYTTMIAGGLLALAVLFRYVFEHASAGGKRRPHGGP